MAKVVKRGVGRPKKVVKRGVGRPNGPAKEVSDAQRIRDILGRFGVDYPASDIKKYLTNPRSKGVGNAVATAFKEQIAQSGKTLDVKISQVRSTLMAKAKLPVRKGKGRMTNTEKELVKVKLQLEAAKAELASFTPVVETPVVETPVVETPVVETPVVETPVVEASAA